MNALKQLEACRQSPWLDDLHRTLISSGELDNLIDDGRAQGPDLQPVDLREGDRRHRRLQGHAEGAARPRATLDDMAVYETIAIADIQAAADRFRPVYEAAGRHDGFVSLEVSPYIANDTEATDRRCQAALEGGRPRKPDDQDPRHRRRHAGHPRRHRRRHQRQRDAAVLGRRPTRTWPRPISRACSNSRPRAAIPSQVAERGELLPEPHRHGGRQEARRR